LPYRFSEIHHKGWPQFARAIPLVAIFLHVKKAGPATGIDQRSER
jgi:hypothetical protein